MANDKLYICKYLGANTYNLVWHGKDYRFRSEVEVPGIPLEVAGYLSGLKESSAPRALPLFAVYEDAGQQADVAEGTVKVTLSMNPQDAVQQIKKSPDKKKGLLSEKSDDDLLIKE